MEEIWKPIRNHENFYLVSNLGRVKRLSTASKRKDGKNYKRSEKILKPYKNKKGYLMVDLDNNCKGQIVHRLVAETYIPNDNPELDTVDHIDGDKSNNSVENLQWMSRGDNIRKSNSIPVIVKSLNTGYTKEYNSIYEAAKDLSLSYSSVCRNIFKYGVYVDKIKLIEIRKKDDLR